MNIRLGLDIDPDTERTFKANFPKAEFVCKDIRQQSVDDLKPYLQRRYNRPRVFGACAPCQPFSSQNRSKHDRDGRRSLLGELHRFVKAYLPEYIFLENVPGLQAFGAQDGPFTDFIRLLNSLNYYYDDQIVMAYNYGVPQSRRRLVLLASLQGPVSIPPPTHGPRTKHPNLPVVWDWISDLPAIEAGEAHTDVPNHRAAKLSAQNLLRIRTTPVGGDRRSWPQTLELECHQKYSGHTDVYGRMLKDRPASALTTRCISLSNGRYGHPTQDRAISVREAACIQTFPRKFTFHGNLNSMARQVGNAVPVEMAGVFGRFIIKHYHFHRKARAA